MSAAEGATGASLPRVVRAVVRLEAIDLVSYPLNAVLYHVSVLVPVGLAFFFARLLPPGQEAVGRDYFTFAIIGYASLVVLQGALSGLAKSIELAQTVGTFETLLVEPASWRLLPLVLSTYHVFSSYVSSLVILLVGVGLGAHIDSSGIPGFFALLSVGMLASLGIGSIVASMILLAKRASLILTGYSMVAGLVAGSMFPIQLIPGWIRWIAYVIPETYVIDSGRQLLMPEPPAAIVPVTTSFLLVAAIAVVTAVAGTALFSRAMEYSRRMGLLSGY
jgi:ABC-2 type transport system permease protein